MKTLHTLTNGERLVLVPADEWDALLVAVEITYDDMESVPEAMREVGAKVWAFFHAVGATLQEPPAS